MRSSVLFTAAFAATALGTPLRKRDLIVETDTYTDFDYVTDVITVTAGQEAPVATSVAAAVTTTAAAASGGFHWGHHSWHWHSHSSSAAAAAPSSSSAAAPAPSSYSAPAPAPISSSSVAAPAPSSSEAAPSPSSYSAPAPAPSSYSAPAPSSSSVAATTTSAASAAMASTYQQAVVNHHNYHRANHSAPSVSWDDSLATMAQEIASSCYYAHDMTKGTYGQNIAAGVPSNNVSHVISDMFYNGEVNNFAGLYGQQSPDMSNFESWGHFSQIVWKGTTKVGCATMDCSSAGGLSNTGYDKTESPYFTVCNYSPPGNYAGEYGSNIGDSLNQATVTYSKDITDPEGKGVSGDGY